MGANVISLRKVESFLTDSLPPKLKRDLRAVRMVKEADLECCAYHHLRRFLRPDRTWDVFVRKHSIHTGHYIDLILFHRGYPSIAIELKWNRAGMSEKDRRSLRRAIQSLRVNRAYFMTTLIGAKNYTKIQKAALEKNRLFEIVIPLPFTGASLKKWKNQRKAFMSRMVRGKGHKKVEA